MKLYYLLGWLLRPFAIVAFYAHSRVFRTPRARVVVQNERGEVLLVKTWLSGGRWGLPGGGLARDEPAEQAALRELHEETGIEASVEELQLLFTLEHAYHDEVVFSLQRAHTDLPTQSPSKFEIEDIRWFSVQELPRLERLSEKVLGKVASKH